MIALAAVSCNQKKGGANGASPEGLSGAGATFPLPYYNVVFKNYTAQTGGDVRYGGIGSGGGIRSLKDKTVDFGASDAFLSEEEMADMPGEIVHIPTCLGAVVLAYNLPGIENLVLNGDLVAGIFLGNITQWNDERLKALNPGITLPNKAITAVYRSDGSGTTFVFSDYLSKVSPEWNEKMGTGKALKWNVGIAAKGNPGVAGVIQQTEGTIGYVGSEYALALGIANAALQNSAGNIVKANTASVSAAADMEVSDDLRVMITNSPVEDAYPISCLTWIICYKEQSYNKRSQAKAQATVDLMNYMLSAEAQSLAEKVHYSPLSPAILEKAKAMVSSITFNNEPL